MSKYLLLNLALIAGCLLLAPWLLGSRVQLKAAAKAALVLTLLAYPWDFMLLHLGAWDHQYAGPVLFRVPIYDLLFVFISTLLAGFVFSHRGETRRRGLHKQTKAKDDCE